MVTFIEFLKEKEDPCWTGYKQYGTKSKGNKKVPNCVPDVSESLEDIIEQEETSIQQRQGQQSLSSPLTNRALKKGA